MFFSVHFDSAGRIEMLTLSGYRTNSHFVAFYKEKRKKSREYIGKSVTLATADDNLRVLCTWYERDLSGNKFKVSVDLANAITHINIYRLNPTFAH